MDAKTIAQLFLHREVPNYHDKPEGYETWHVEKFLREATIKDKATIYEAYEILDGYSINYETLDKYNFDLATQDKDLLIQCLTKNSELYKRTRSITKRIEHPDGGIEFKHSHQRVLPKQFINDPEVAIAAINSKMSYKGDGIVNIFKYIPKPLRNNPDVLFAATENYGNLDNKLFTLVDLDLKPHKDRLAKALSVAGGGFLKNLPDWVSDEPEICLATLNGRGNLYLNATKLYEYLREEEKIKYQEEYFPNSHNLFNFNRIKAQKEILEEIITIKNLMGTKVWETGIRLSEVRKTIFREDNLRNVLNEQDRLNGKEPVRPTEKKRFIKA